jgi:RNA polymerase sigma-70 factor (ECF subfamily)
MNDGRREDEDAADAGRVLAGNPAAFEGIVRRWQERLVTLAWRFCRDRAMAEDMAQDAFVRAYKSLRTYRGDAAFSTWLTAVALNSYRSALRDRPPVSFDFDPARMHDRHRHGDRQNAFARMLRLEHADIVRRLVLTLPSRYREPIVLYYFEEMNLAETARVLALPEGTLKARLHRGRELLRRRLAAVGLSGKEHAGDA